MKAVLYLLAGLVLLFIATIASTVIGAFSGWVVGMLFPGTLALVTATLFGTAIPAWQLGASLGFVGSFFRSTLSSSGKS